MFIFVAMRGDQIRAIRRATDGDFAFRAAAHRTNLFALSRTKARGFALSTNRTIHNDSPGKFRRLGSILRAIAKHNGNGREDLVLTFSRAPCANVGYAMMTLFWKRRAAMISRKRAHGEEGERIRPQMDDAGAAQNHAAGDVDEIAGRNEIAERVEKLGHGLARENISGKKDARQDGEKRELHGFGLGIGFAGNENAEGETKRKYTEAKESASSNTLP